MKFFDGADFAALIVAIPSAEVLETRIGIVSTNYYDPGTSFHGFVDNGEDVNQRLAALKSAHPALNFSLAYVQLVIKH